MADGLAARGHNVTVIAPDIVENPPQGVHYILLEGVYNDDHRAHQKGLFNFNKLKNPIVEPINYYQHKYWSCKGKAIRLSSDIELTAQSEHLFHSIIL